MKLARNDRACFEAVLASLRTYLPELAWWITPEVEPALHACYQAEFEIDGTADALARLACPVLLWSGTEDDCHDRMAAAARDVGAAFFATRGDHGSAVVLERERVLARIAEHVRTAEPRPRST